MTARVNMWVILTLSNEITLPLLPCHDTPQHAVIHAYA